MEFIINEANFEELKASGKPVIVDFGAAWCGPCRHVAPIIEKLAEEYNGKIIIGTCDVDQNNALAAQFSVRSIPTVVFLKPDGTLMHKEVGLASKELYAAKAAELLA
jgi:thioredoxin 1